ncbi:transcription factor Spi-C-like [Chanos chanos]|uniref:Transcription factor Spi-C-like n=1 Tax=Chanos chanos TaxID=29144 RepID=A0A6J2VXN4_CHACN|nr:transcription factor Spi-C [Chanos chanos]
MDFDGLKRMEGSLDSDINQDFQDAIDVIQRHSNILYYDTENKYYETLESQQPPLAHSIACFQFTTLPEGSGPTYEWSDASPWNHSTPDVSTGPLICAEPPPFYPSLSQRSGKGRKKLRLYEYLYEALHDANMVDSIQWTDSSSGVFHFISKNKEKLAECWGQRKGNRKTMTYQKMARALRNYSRTGEIVKVRRKLTYQFNPAILQRLGGGPTVGLGSRPSAREPMQQSGSPYTSMPTTPAYYGAAAPNEWHSWYGQCSYQGEYDLTTVLTASESPKTCIPTQ